MKLPLFAALATLSVLGRPAWAISTTDPSPDPDNDPPCIKNLVVNYFSNNSPIPLGGTATLYWSVTVPRGCAVQFQLSGASVGRSGSSYVAPNASSGYALKATYGSISRVIADTTVSVTLPPTVNITQNYGQSRLFIQALGTPNTNVAVADGVDLDLTNTDSIAIASNVTLYGHRSATRPGARLYTRSHPHQQFLVVGDNVRITGLRIEGAEVGSIPDDTAKLSKGIVTASALSVQIDNNEISGWSSVGVQVTNAAFRIVPLVNGDTVHIHDNYIHDNQYYGKDGYGVSMGPGGYALVQRNVFDSNRHSIASSGEPFSGYHAYYNLVLEHGGFHRWWGWPYGWDHTHAFDVHGTDNCGVFDLVSDALYNCGMAGFNVDIRYNTFLYTAGPDFKLRGTPQSPDGSTVAFNVFAHSDIDKAVQQTETGLHQHDNLTGINGMNELAQCDMDGDGTVDNFLATGQTWWYSPGGNKPWVYLNASTLRRAQLQLGYFDSKAGCDVKDPSGIIYSSGRPTRVWHDLPRDIATVSWQ